uniref:Papilin n=1 Tax=Strigamia maritima TaxID=126957 RepID=T1JGC4_STRMM
MPVGCDLILGSNATEDKCRECRGDGSTCKSVQGLFDLDNLLSGYNDILLIPTGATNIHIEERKATNNFLAIRNLTGHYYLNGNWRIDSPRDLFIAGTTFHYARRPTEFQTPEALSALGPTTEPIYIMLLYQEKNLGIVYEYFIPKDVKALQADTYLWRHESFDECSRECGGGVQTRKVYCTRTNSVEVVDDFLCDSALKPIGNKTCNKHSCPAKWHIGGWEECSATCGGGIQYRMVFCQQMQNGDSLSVVNNNLCLKVVGPRPKHTRSCNIDVTCPVWRSSSWTPCNKLCGNGEQSRTVTCQRIVTGHLYVFPDQACNMSQKPQTKRKCHNGPCEGVDWIVSEWAGCDTCGKLRESRLVHCSNKSGSLFPNDLCDHDRQPEFMRDCPDTSSCEYMWIGTEWSECSATCGDGVQSRSSFCVQQNGENIKKVDDSNCDPAKKYDTTQECSGKLCEGVWFSAQWDKCTSLCGGGSRTRKIVCMVGNKVGADSECDATMKPDGKETCNMKPCDSDEMIILEGCKDSKYGCCDDNVTSSLGPGGLGCPLSVNEEDCGKSEFGCCQDGETAALGPFKEGCPKIASCEETKFNCCSDGISAAKGPNNEGCPDPDFDCSTSTYKCCPDGFTPAKGENFLGCDYDDSDIGCKDTPFGCCPDGMTMANGPNFDGCNGDDNVESSGEDCQSTTFGCCPGSSIAAQNPDKSDCPGDIIPIIPDYGGLGEIDEDDCIKSRFGCCKDLLNAALGPNEEGCQNIGITPLPIDCAVTPLGCCPDGVTAILGPNNAGCGKEEQSECANTLFGCCPDNKTEAKDPNKAGCEEESTTAATSTAGSDATTTTDEDTTTTTDKDATETTEDTTKTTEKGAITSSSDPTTGGTDVTTGGTDVTTGGTDVTTDGTDVTTDGTDVTTDGTDVTTDGTDVTTDGTDVTTDGTDVTTDGTEVTTDGTDVTTDGTDVTTDGTVITSGKTDTSTGKDCSSSEFGCCEDQITPAEGPKFKGCPEPAFPMNCAKTKYGCCADGLTEMKGPNKEGCPFTGDADCFQTPFGCCPDKKTEAKGPGSLGCPCDAMQYGCCPDGINFARGENYQGCGCMFSKFGCCSDGFTEATGPDEEGCSCDLGLFGCCPDGKTEASGPNFKGCCEISEFGCCTDNSTAATGPNNEGCGCDSTEFGCCTDGTTAAAGPNKAGCGCDTTEFGCCPDFQTAAGGTNYDGCPCYSMPFGCCPDNQTPAQGENFLGCDCSTTVYGCCPDGQTPAQGFEEEGCGSCESTEFGCCPDRTTPAQGFHNEGCETCEKSPFGCCPDGHTLAQGPQNAGCGCRESVYGCCPDGQTPAQGYHNEGCEETCEKSLFGCCPDGTTHAQGPQNAGCGCRESVYGCCPDGQTSAQGSQHEGCEETCEKSQFGCCPDGRTPARGPQYAGCGCRESTYGCCPDGVTSASGDNHEGCDDCERTEFGCCADEKTPARGPNQEGCGCESSRWGCCPDGVTFARGKDHKGCECGNTRFGCCPDGVTAASGPQYDGCEERPPTPGSMKAGVVCGLVEDRGSCSNYTVKWRFDMEYGGCARFWYGGCEGNDNRFDSQEECEEVCVIPEGMNACQLPKATGQCTTYTVAWYYDVPSGQCGQFYYGGCLGNNNRFATQEECERTCGHTQVEDPCQLPKLEGPCNNNYISWYFDKDEVMCKEFRYGGCKGNRNNFPTERDCIQQCASKSEKEACLLPKEVGPCSGQYTRWFYNIVESQCKPFNYGGCQGNTNRFESLQQCQVSCNDTKVGDVCSLPKVEGPCQERAVKWYHDSNEDRCLQFYYGGCDGNANRFETELECQHVCSAVEVADVCALPSDHGPCSSAAEERWYFNQNSGRCDQFIYGGCGGNGNNYVSLAECEHRCGVKITTADEFKLEDCHLDKAYGRCDDSTIRWYYKKDTGVCEQFHYSGCNGNNNRFETRPECEEKCFHSQEICELPKVVGPCSGQFSQWYFNPQADQCEEFQFGGCLGNGNRFNTFEDCQARCKKTVESSSEQTGVSADPCTLPRDVGPCQSSVHSWYFDGQERACKAFVFGGCGGNTNRFVSEESCKRACGEFKGHDVCSLPNEHGPCVGEFPKWYHDPTDNECKTFVYGGCSGNGNRFESKKECEQVCIARKFFNGNGNEISLSEICRLPPDAGPCTNFERRWHYDSVRGTCIPFDFGGCRGNKNRFKSFDVCLGFCSAPTCPEPEECSVLSCPYGIEEYQDDNGCSKCRCANPCNGISCPEGTTCVVQKQEYEIGGHPVCRRNNKLGQCPRVVVVSKDLGQCIDECHTDVDCEFDYKCCQNGCGRRCLHPFAEPSHIHPPEEVGLIERRPSPHIDPSDEEVRVRVNNTARIPCIAHGDPSPFVYWRKDGQDMPVDGGRIKYVHEYLEIQDVVSSDLGVYTCVADNGFGTPAEKNTRLIVEEPARILPGVRVVVVAVGSPCLLDCKAIGYPNPKVTWWRGYIMLPRTSEKYDQLSNYSLLIRTVVETDYGDYSCQAHNGIGDPARWHVTVLDPHSKKSEPYPDPRSYYNNPPQPQNEYFFDNPTTNPTTNESEEAYYYYEDDDNVALEDAPVDNKEVGMKDIDESVVLGRFLDHPVKKSEKDAVFAPIKSWVSETEDPIELANKVVDEISFETLELPISNYGSAENSFQSDILLHDNTNQTDFTSVSTIDSAQDDTQISTTTHIDSVPVSAEIQMDSTVFPMNSDIRIDCATNGSDALKWFKDDAKLIPGPRVQIISNGTVVIYNAKPSDTGTYKCEATNEFNSASSSVSITINGFELHVNCTDNPYFANCKLVVKANYCSNVYYARFCCKSCTLAGHLPVSGSHLNNNKVKK